MHCSIQMRLLDSDRGNNSATRVVECIASIGKHCSDFRSQDENRCDNDDRNEANKQTVLNHSLAVFILEHVFEFVHFFLLCDFDYFSKIETAGNRTAEKNPREKDGPIETFVFKSPFLAI